MTDRELMQQALDALFMFVEYDYQGNPLGGAHFNGHRAIEALRARLAQPEPEPVWVEVTTNTGDKFILDSAIEADKIRAAKNVGLSVVPLYTAPPQREWQGLTDEEIMDACSAVWASHPIEVGRVVEEKLKEKNT